MSTFTLAIPKPFAKAANTITHSKHFAPNGIIKTYIVASANAVGVYTTTSYGQVMYAQLREQPAPQYSRALKFQVVGPAGLFSDSRVKAGLVLTIEETTQGQFPGAIAARCGDEDIRLVNNSPLTAEEPLQPWENSGDIQGSMWLLASDFYVPDELVSNAFGGRIKVRLNAQGCTVSREGGGKKHHFVPLAGMMTDPSAEFEFTGVGVDKVTGLFSGMLEMRWGTVQLPGLVQRKLRTLAIRPVGNSSGEIRLVGVTK